MMSGEKKIKNTADWREVPSARRARKPLPEGTKTPRSKHWGLFVFLGDISRLERPSVGARASCTLARSHSGGTSVSVSFHIPQIGSIKVALKKKGKERAVAAAGASRWHIWTQKRDAEPQGNSWAWIQHSGGILEKSRGEPGP